MSSTRRQEQAIVSRRAQAFREARATSSQPTVWLLSGLTFLETKSVLAVTATDYQKRVQSFLDWCQVHLFTQVPLDQLDHLVALFMDGLYFRGLPPEDGTKLVAAIKFALKGTCPLLPRAERALKGWRKTVPSFQRLPLPWLCLAAIIGHLLHRQELAAAVALVLGFVGYFRPGELESLTNLQVVRPPLKAAPGYNVWGIILSPAENDRAGKTGLWDSSVLIDTCLWVTPALEALKNRLTEPSQRFWPFKLGHLQRVFGEAVVALQLEPLRPTLYSIRHGAASEDILRKRRTLAEVKKRGRWSTDQSLRRYGKETRLLAQMNLLPPSTLEFGRLMDLAMEGIFIRGDPLPPLPISR